jgi:hypothetical protein
MIQFNLLPDVKLEYIRAQRTKRLVMTVSVLVAIASLAILVILLMTVFVFQKQHMKHLTSDITKYSNDLKATPDLDKILTIQNQLGSLASIHEQKPEVNRIIPFIKEVTPSDASISSLNVDFATNTMVITGSADTLVTVNKYVDTLKFTHYSNGQDSPLAFSAVVLTSFGKADKGASYSINLAFDPVIFDNTQDIKLTVPNIVSTRSSTEKPDVLFESTGKEQ